ncbi:hypothetical protein ACWWJF_12265 [Symbiopectobacterium sp. Eva_TO]
MSETIKAYLYAAASVLDIWPSTNYLELLDKTSDQDAIKGDVCRVAMDMRAMVQHESQEPGHHNAA